MSREKVHWYTIILSKRSVFRWDLKDETDVEYLTSTKEEDKEESYVIFIYIKPQGKNINSFVTLTILDVYCWASVLLFLPLHPSFYKGIHLFFRRQITLWNVTVFNSPATWAAIFHLPSQTYLVLYLCVSKRSHGCQ